MHRSPEGNIKVVINELYQDKQSLREEEGVIDTNLDSEKDSERKGENETWVVYHLGE